MTYRIGSGQGYYGDDVTRALPMILGEHVDVVCFEALAELTLAILQKDKLKDPSRGYTFDIAIIASKILPEAYKRKIPLILNGGGLNPLGAAQVIYETAQKLGLKGLKIAAVTGDDVRDRLEALIDAGEKMEHLETGEPLDPTSHMLANANVYMGAKPIVDALNAGADIIITGRIADPCLYLAPLIAHYDWAWDDWDKLASGIVAGHLLECTAQVVGGNSLGVIDTIDAAHLSQLGYPIAQVESDGSFVLTKTPDTHGIVNLRTVKEQLLYEVHDPANYITPDVITNFTTLALQEIAENQVRVSGVTGKPRPDKLKLTLGQMEGYMRELIFTVGYPEAWKKVDQLKAMIESTWDGLPIERVDYSYLGHNSLYGNIAPPNDDPLEIIVRVMFTAKDEKTLKTAVRKMMTHGLSGAAGMSISGTTISAKPRIVLGLFPTLLSREHIQARIQYKVVE
ncbi:MAG: acyclic terpene utilization AtuA family protein [Anaerolineae bacterium]|nr:acyclic terpene utilization AtuA family protein [Anaerolineae bacterium]